jgi:hypothetical protein
MGSMSASDAAPLPRLGEVFFDVRGESRTMRLSWYADTGVAVFSIWQGGTCTGTFRLPIPDLPRMVEALQGGPHAQDNLVPGEQVPGEQPGSRERRPPTVPSQRGPARPARPDPLDGDIETGQTTAAVHSPPVGPDVTGYQAGPPPGYVGEPPPAAHPDPLGYPAEPPAAHLDPPGYPGEPPAAHLDPLGYPAEPPAAHLDPLGYPGEPPAAHPDPLGYPGEPLADGAGYPAGLAEPAEDFTAGYAAEPSVDFAAERGPRHSRPPTGRRSSGHRAAGYPEDPPSYPDEPGAAAYPDEPADGYLGDDTLLAPGYSGDDQADPLGTGPVDYDRPSHGRRGREPGYRDEPDDYQPYPEELPATEYDSPVRRYVTDAGDTDEPFAEDPPERPKSRGRRRAGPTPDSFPYGPPPAGDEPRPRGRYPGRH